MSSTTTLARLEPDLDKNDRTKIELAHAQDEATGMVLHHDILNWLRSELMESDLRALEADTKLCLEADLEMLDFGLNKAGASPAGAAMAAKAIDGFSRRTDHLLRRYHG